MPRKVKSSAGKMSMADMRKMINKKAGMNVAHDLKEANPTEVTQWIPTGSRWLDSIICRGHYAGIPVGKVSEIAGLEATGKSYMAAQIAANAQEMGMDVVYFDSESAIDPSFLENAGCDLERLLYVQAQSVEFVLETIEDDVSAWACVCVCQLVCMTHYGGRGRRGGQGGQGGRGGRGGRGRRGERGRRGSYSCL